MANNLAQIWKISFQVEPIDSGFILFCENKDSFSRLMNQLAKNFTPDPVRNHPDLSGVVRWKLRFAKHPPNIPIERCLDFIQKGLILVYGSATQFEVDAGTKQLIVDFPANITAGNLLTKSLEMKDKKKLDEFEKFLSE